MNRFIKGIPLISIMGIDENVLTGQSLIEDFSNYLLAKGLMERTMSTYIYYFKLFTKNLDGEINTQYINLFIRKNNNVVARAFISNYLSYLNRRDLMPPKITGSSNKTNDLVKYISREDINKINLEFDGMSNRVRNKLMLSLSFFGALRENELLTITPKDCLLKEWKENEDKPLSIRIIGKRKKQRIIYITPNIARILDEYITKVRDKLIFNETEDKDSFKLFGNKGNGIGARRWRQILVTASNRALKKKIHPHMLRHSFAMYAKDNLGWTLEKISKYLGHSSLQTTLIYAKTTNPELESLFEKGFPNIENGEPNERPNP